jgi:hypothetical protein
MWIKTHFLKFDAKVRVLEWFRYKQLRRCSEFTFETSLLSILTLLTNENHLCTRGIMRSDKLHAFLATTTTLNTLFKANRVFLYLCFYGAPTNFFGHINLDYTGCLTLCDKQNHAPRRSPFTVSWVYHDSGAWSRPFTAEAYVRFHASPCGVCVGLSGTGTRFFLLRLLLFPQLQSFQ